MRHRFAIYWILLISLFPLFLGGDLERWVQGIALCLMGMLYLASPPRHPVGHGIGWVSLALFAAGLSAFLPASWFGIPEWRAEALSLGINLPGTLSPQPWISLDYVLLLGAGLLWVYYLTSRSRQRGERSFVFRALGIALLVFATASLAGYIFKWIPPMWEGQKYFGSIANRNQTALVLCLTAMVAIGCSYYEFQGRHRMRAFAWAAFVPVVFAGIAINESRAGVLLFFGGVGTWFAITAMRRRSGGIFAAAGSFLLLLIASFLLFGGKTLERFTVREEGIVSEVKAEARVEIFSNTLNLIADAPVSGIGFGNFGPVYALNRDLTEGTMVRRVAQPDNDLLWLAAETGAVGLLLAIALIALLIRRSIPSSRKKGSDRRSESLRLMALSCVVLFCIDGLVNIPGHRLAPALLGFLLLSCALPANRHRHSSVLLGSFYRVAGVALIAVGCTWIFATAKQIAIPGIVGIEILTDKANTAQQEGRLEEARAHIDDIIRLEPLRYRHYFKRATYTAELGGTLEESIADFQRARILEPAHPIIPMGEADFWLSLRPTLAIPAIEEAIRRQPQGGPIYLRQLSLRSGLDRRFQKALATVASTDPELLVMYISALPREDQAGQIERILEGDPQLKTWNRLRKKQLFHYWYYGGDRDALIGGILRYPEWEEAGWLELCTHHKFQNDFAAALEVATRHIVPPVLPRTYESRSAENLQSAFSSNPTDVALGIQLYSAETARDNHEAALLALEKVALLPDAPDFVYYLLAIGRSKASRHREAWEAMEKYISKQPPR